MKWLNKLMILIFVVGVSLFLFSCEKRQQDYEWTGKNLEIQSIFEPVLALRYKPSEAGWRLVNSFSQPEELWIIINCLCEPEEEKKNIISKDLPHETLWLFFFNSRTEEFTRRKICFKLEGGIFIGPRGNSQQLGKLFLETKEREAYYLTPDFSKIQEAQKGLQEEAAQRKLLTPDVNDI